MNGFFSPILLFFYNNLAFHNLGLTIIEIAILSRVIFYPLLKQQMASTLKMRELQPKMDALKKKHKNDKQALVQAQMQLYKEHNFNPAAGCLPSLIPIVVLIGLSNALSQVLTTDINTQFLIWDMGVPDVVRLAGLPFPLPGLLVIAAAATQYFYTKLLLPPPPKIRKEDKPQEKEEKADFMASFAEAQTSMAWMFPLIFLFFGLSWPSGLALYWTVSSLISIVLHKFMQPKSALVTRT